MELLKVSLDVLETFGSVSIAVAWGMAQGVLGTTRADVAVAITGIAGPDGGSEKKPIGTVVFARAERDEDPENVVADTRVFANEGRGTVRLQADPRAVELLMPDAAHASSSARVPTDPVTAAEQGVGKGKGGTGEF